MQTYEVIAEKVSTAKFSITADSREDAEKAIADKILSGTEVAWKDQPDVRVATICENIMWRPRRQFALKNGEQVS